MSDKVDYYSFRNEPIEMDGAANRCEQGGNVAFTHDVTKGIPQDYEKCDIIYCEPSWLAGYGIFEERAGTKVGSYERYLGFFKILTATAIPVVLVLGKNALKKMNPFWKDSIPVKLNGTPETAYSWNIRFPLMDIKTNYDLIRALATRYDRVGDMCCGYGNTARIFKEEGKNFVVSDINEKLINFIADNYMDGEDKRLWQ